MWDSANKRFSWFKSKQNVITVQKSGLIPPAMVDESRVPKFYKETIIQCGADHPSKLPEVAQVFSLMWRSGLPESVLQAIWESVAPTNQNVLSRQEFYSCLVLIALAQRNLTIADLGDLPTLPIPHLSVAKSCANGVVKGFKNDATLTKPNGHLLKTVHPLFTEQNVKVNRDLIKLGTDSTDHNKDSCDLDLYPSSSNERNNEPSHSDRFVPIWERVVNSASEIFSMVQQTNQAILPCFKTEKGYRFVRSLHEVERVIRRIHRSARSCPSMSTDLVSRCEILLGVWTNLVDVLECDELLEHSEQFDRTEHLCNICAEKTNVDNTHFDEDTELSYHVSCANLWLNTVEGRLPKP